MPEHVIAHGEIWLHPDESVVETVVLGATTHLGLVTTRQSGFVYASLLTLGDRVGYCATVPRWEFTVLERAICGSVSEAKTVILRTAESMLVKHRP